MSVSPQAFEEFLINLLQKTRARFEVCRDQVGTVAVSVLAVAGGELQLARSRDDAYRNKTTVSTQLLPV